MASLSPTESAPATRQATRPRWWQWQSLPPLDEETRQKRARVFVQRAPYLFGGSVAVIVVGSFIETFPGWQALALCFCGLVGTKFQLIGLRATNSEKFFVCSGVLTIFTVVFIPNQAHRTFLSTMGVGIVASAYSGGTMSLLFWLFGEPFSRYIMTPEEPTSLPAPPRIEDSMAQHNASVAALHRFDY